MQARSADVFKSIPDYEQFMKLASEISALSFKKLKLESHIKAKESDTFKIANTDEKYFQNGKPPSSTFIDNTYRYCGIDGSILPLRLELSEITSSLEEKRLQFDIYKTMVDIWRTLCSSERSSSL